MKYIVINLSNFSVLTEDIFDEEGSLKTAKVFNCETDAKLASKNLTDNGSFSMVVVPLKGLPSPVHEEMLQRQAQRIQDQQREIESLTAQLEDEHSGGFPD